MSIGHHANDGVVVIVGAGQAGGRAAEALRLNSYAGPVILVGEEAHPPYERPSLSKDFLRKPELGKIVWVRPHAWYEQNKIALMAGRRAVTIERDACRIRLDDGSALRYETLILATGARPRLLDVEGADHPAVTYLRTIDDGLRLQKRTRRAGHIVIVGAGFIGLEVAAAARQMGSAVTVLEQASLPMARAVPPIVGQFYADFHRSRGIDLRLGIKLRRIVDRAGQAVVEYDDGALQSADAIVIGVGVLPNIEIARDAGLRTENGIVVDEYGRTEDPAIFGAGDVTCHFNPMLGCNIRLESWQNAQNQAISVARNVMGAGLPYAEIPWFWSDQFELNLQIAGCPQPGDEIVSRGVIGQGPAAIFYLRAGKLVAVVGINSPREVRFGKDIISMGGGIASPDLSDPAIDLMRVARAMKSARRA